MASITFESFIRKQAIEIPAIQRDYVQGRGVTVEEQDKREAFVTKLINAIVGNNDKPCHLEFIYGAVNKTSHHFIPLDGQQRLTTLFLLHWVVWNLSSVEAKKNYPLSLIAGFKYETRISSRNFCEYMISKDLLPVDDADSLGDRLVRQPWFSEDWNYDPTVKAMLSMIDFIEQKLSTYSTDEITVLLEKLCGDNNVISFDELNMTDYDLTDSLYIKMNARGKHLTPFENWKSDFIKFLEMAFGDEEYPKADKTRASKSYSYKDYFSYSIEHQWTDLFWTYLKEEFLQLDDLEQQKKYPSIDKMFMNLFDFLCMFCFYTQGKTDYPKASATEKKEIWQRKDFVDFLFGALDSLCRIDHNSFFDNLFYISDVELPQDNKECKVRLFRTRQCNLFRLCVDNGSSMELTDLLLFYALLHYCDKSKISSVTDSLKSYMRKVRNYFESDIQNIRTRTTVQLNLRVSEFAKYHEHIKKLADLPFDHPSLLECIIDDCSITHGNTKVFKKAIEDFGCQCVVDTLDSFCKASTSDRIRMLVACGFRGTYLSDCVGRNRYFFGNKDKWDVLFISDEQQLSTCFSRLTSAIKDGKDTAAIINDALAANHSGFIHYMMKYDDFLNANNSQHHFAIKGDINRVNVD